MDIPSNDNFIASNLIEFPTFSQVLHIALADIKFFSTPLLLVPLSLCKQLKS